MNGFGKSIVGTQTSATNKKNIERAYYPEFDPTTAFCPSSIAPPLKNIPIIMVITDGASFSLLVKSVHHLHMIIRSIYPKRTQSNII